MKKTLLLFVLVIGTAKLKAQSLNNMISPVPDKNSAGAFLRIKPDSGLLKPFNITPSNNVVTITTPTVYSRMPVAKLSSADKMPVARLGEPNVHYTMLVKKYDVVNPDTVRQKTVFTP